MEELEAKIGYSFRDRGLLELALTHSSYANERQLGKEACNERLEFLGDAVLGMTVAEFIFKTYPTMPEGQMSRLRADLVCEKSLAAIAGRLELGKYLRLGHGEMMGGGRERASITADATEALIAAMYLDGGFEVSHRFISENLTSNVEKVLHDSRDNKTVLQEYVQSMPGMTMAYELVNSRGPDHMKEFEIRVLINGEEFSRGVGRSKKLAEQQAAQKALERFGV